MRKKGLMKRLGAMLVATTMLVGLFSTNVFALEPEEGKTGSITVHKYSTVTEPTASNPTGEVITDTSSFGTPLSGAEFTVYPLTMPTLTTGQTITGIASWNGNVPTFNITDGTTPTTGAGTLGAASAKTTAADGTAKWDTLDQGYYVLAETKTPAGYETADPCVVTLPLTKADGTGFVYDVNVYPKNVSDTDIVKTIDDPTKIYSVGDTVDFTITQAIKNADSDPKVTSAANLKDGGDYGTVEITDKLVDALTYQSSEVTFVGDDGEETLTVTDDYTLDQTDGLKWTLTSGGIDKLIAKNATSVKVKLSTELTVSGEKVTNTASGLVLPANVTTPTDPIPTDPVDVPTISITIDKQDAADATGATKLAGAKFVVATNEAGTKFLKADGTETEDITEAVTATTGDDGVAVLDGLKYDKAAGSQYYLVEAAAPAGYQIKEAAITVEKFAANLTEETTKNVTVKNYANGTTDPDNPKFSLPLTGGTGTWMFIVIGLLIMGTAITFYVRSKKNRA